MPLTEPNLTVGYIFNAFRPGAISKMIDLKTPLLIIVCFLFMISDAFSQKDKPVELIVECVEYIGDGTYVATFGYDNPNKSEIIVAETNSVVIYNYGQSKKNVVNKLLSGRQKNVFTQEFNSKDRCEWRFYLPNGTEKTTTANSNSNHCKSGLGLDPIFDGQAEGGIIWPELYYLSRDYVPGEAKSNEVFQITTDDQVLIEIIVNNVSYLTDPVFLATMSNLEFVTISTTETTLKLTGHLPISRVLELNTLGQYINFVEPLYTPIPGSGTILTQGDSAQRTDVVRGGWSLNGAGLKVGLLSDSFDNLGKASDDVKNGNLPGDYPERPEGTPPPINDTEVVLVKEYPANSIFNVQRDEGRAMAQIVHDIVPEADQFFHTAMISSGDFASGIIKLADDYSCNMIGDDITYISEPYFQDGIISQAVKYVTTKPVDPVYYVTSAGNFGQDSWESVSAPISFNRRQFDFLPNDNTLLAHDFGNGEIKQSLFLMPGRYLIKFEWDEPFYTLPPHDGATTDYDIWVVSDDDLLLYTGRRDNVGEDPQEYMAFTVPGDQAFPVNFLITASDMQPNQRLKYTFFVKPVEGFVWNNEYTGINAGTIVGQANAAEAVTVGAVLYSNTPAYNNVPTPASFSSRGGVWVEGGFRDKPDFMAPNGGWTTVFLGAEQVVDGQVRYPFYGTSASAPHHLGLAAQVIEAGKLYKGQVWSPETVKSKMLAGVIDMGIPGPDNATGKGFVEADAVLKDLGNPKPKLKKITATLVDDPSIILTDPDYTGEIYDVTLLADGDYFTEESEILVRGVPVFTNFINASQLNAEIELSGDPEISVYTPSKEGTIEGSNGGSSETFKLFDVPKTTVTITSKSKEKFYLEVIPENLNDYYEYNVSGLPEGVTLESLGLEMTYVAPATTFSNVGSDWGIMPTFVNPPGPGLTELYDFVFPPPNEQGTLNIKPLTIKIKPNDITGLTYGDVPNIESEIIVLTQNVTIPQSILDEIYEEYQSYFPKIDEGDDEYAIVNLQRGLANLQRGLANLQRGLANGSAWMISDQVLNLQRGLANLQRGLANTVEFNGELLADYQASPGGTAIKNLQRGLANLQRGLVNSQYLADGSALTNAAIDLNDGNGLVNSSLFNLESNSEVALIFQEDDTGLDPIANIYPINVVTGLTATNAQGDNPYELIIPGAYISNGRESDGRYHVNNFIIQYENGKATINPKPITIEAYDAVKVYGQDDPIFIFDQVAANDQLEFYDVFSGALGRETPNINDVGSYLLTIGSLVAGDPVALQEDPLPLHYGESYVITIVGADEGPAPALTINPATITVEAIDNSKTYGDPDPELSYTFDPIQLLHGDVEADVFGTGQLSRDAGENVTITPYDITQGDFGLISTNYTLNFIEGEFTIIQAELIVSAISEASPIYEGDPLPEFTFEYSGWKQPPGATASDGLDNVIFDLDPAKGPTDPAYSGDPGVYKIIFNYTTQNYSIMQEQLNDPGVLYVNPWDDLHIHPRLDCIEENPYYNSADPTYADRAPYPYVAHLYYDNPYSTEVFLPAGEERNILYYASGHGEFLAEKQPNIFFSGNDMGLFDVYFDGNRLIWALTSGSSTKTAAISSDASEGSARCKLSNGRIASPTAERLASSKFELSEISGYPNPASDTYFVNLSEAHVASVKVSLADIQGKMYHVQVTRNPSSKRLEVDLTTLNSGLYLLQLKLEHTQKIIKIIKQ